MLDFCMQPIPKNTTHRSLDQLYNAWAILPTQNKRGPPQEKDGKSQEFLVIQYVREVVTHFI